MILKVFLKRNKTVYGDKSVSNNVFLEKNSKNVFLGKQYLKTVDQIFDVNT